MIDWPRLTDEKIRLLKREMNFLLWTSDPPPVDPAEFLFESAKEPVRAGRVNMQCVSHAYVTAGLFARYGLHLFKGYAFISIGDGEDLHQIGHHYWVVMNQEYMADFSLHADEWDVPAVYGQRCVPGDWEPHIAKSLEEVLEIVSEPRRNCVYLMLKISRVEIYEIVGPCRRNEIEDVLGEIAMGIDEPNAVAKGDMLDKEVSEQCCFPRTRFSYDVDVETVIGKGNAKWRGITPAAPGSDENMSFCVP